MITAWGVMPLTFLPYLKLSISMHTAQTFSANPRVTVIIPAYNAAKYLDACLESMTCQSETSLEILVIDDGSTDETAKIVTAWVQRDPRVQLFQQVNQGVSAARNAGFDRARGTYIAVQDADDFSHPERLKIQADFLDAHSDIDFVGTYAKRIDENGRSLGYIKPPTCVETIREVMKTRLAYVHPSLMFRRTLIDAGMRYDTKLKSAEDREMLANIFEKHASKNLSKPLYFYRSIPNQLTQEHAIKGAIRSIWAREQLRRRMMQQEPLTHLSENFTRTDAVQLGLDPAEVDRAVLERFEYIMRLNLRARALYLNRKLAKILMHYAESCSAIVQAEASALAIFYGGLQFLPTTKNIQTRSTLQQLVWREARYRAHILKSSWEFRAWNYSPNGR